MQPESTEPQEPQIVPEPQHPVVQALQGRYELQVTNPDLTRGELELKVPAAQILPVCELLKSEQGFNRLSSVTALDWYPQEPRFEIIYLLHSLDKNQRVRLKVELGEGEEIDSVFSVWRTADWYEREVFDLFGVPFRQHPNLKRILMPEDWEGHPLRKDYPVHGHKYDYAEHE